MPRTAHHRWAQAGAAQRNSDPNRFGRRASVRTIARAFLLCGLLPVGVRAAIAQDFAPAPAVDGAANRPADATTAIAGAPDPWTLTGAAPSLEDRPVRRPPSAVPARPVAGAGRDATAWLRTALSLGGVVALIVLLAWGYRLVVSSGRGLRRTGRGRHAPLIEVVGRSSLAPRQSLCLVRIGPRLVLIGATQNSLTPLDVIEDADLVAQLLGDAERRKPDSHSEAFDRCLAGEAVAYADGDDPGPRPHPDGAPRMGVAAVQTRLAATLDQLRAAAARSLHGGNAAGGW